MDIYVYSECFGQQTTDTATLNTVSVGQYCCLYISNFLYQFFESLSSKVYDLLKGFVVVGRPGILSF